VERRGSFTTANSAAIVCEHSDISTRYRPGSTVGPAGGSPGSANGLLRGGASLVSRRLRSGYFSSHTNRLSPGRTDGRFVTGKLLSSLQKLAPLVIERERDRAGNALIQPVMDYRAVRRILPDVQKFAIAGPVWLAKGSDPAAYSGSKCERDAARPEASQGPEMQLCANRRAGLKEATSGAAVDEASQRRDVVQDPELAAVGSRHQVCSLDLQIVNGATGRPPPMRTQLCPSFRLQ